MPATKHACFSGPGGRPCGKMTCRLCYLFATDMKYRLAWGGTADGLQPHLVWPGDVAATAADRSKPCRWKGDTLRDGSGRAKTREIVTAGG